MCSVGKLAVFHLLIEHKFLSTCDIPGSFLTHGLMKQGESAIKMDKKLCSQGASVVDGAGG